MLLALALACSPAGFGVGARERASEAGEVLVVLNESFLNALLVAVASQPEPPSFPLSKGGGNEKCPSRVQLLREAKALVEAGVPAPGPRGPRHPVTLIRVSVA